MQGFPAHGMMRKKVQEIVDSKTQKTTRLSALSIGVALQLFSFWCIIKTVFPRSLSKVLSYKRILPKQAGVMEW